MTLWDIKKELKDFEDEIKSSYNHNVIQIANDKAKYLARKYEIRYTQSMFLAMVAINNVLNKSGDKKI